MCQVIYWMLKKMLKTKMNISLQGQIKKAPIIIDNNTKIKLMKILKISKSSVDEQKLNNPISENINGKRD